MADNHRKIIEVATQLMSRKGYHGTSLQMVADKVGITKSTIFHHFKNKEAILLGILEDAIPSATYNLMVLANDKDLSGCEKLQKFIAMHMKLVAERGDILTIYLGESRYLNEQNARMHKEGRIHYTNLVKQIVDQIKSEDRNRFSGLDSGIVANGILGFCNWSVRWYRNGGPMALDKVCEQLYGLIDPY